jgi:hypothetical protein
MMHGDIVNCWHVVSTFAKLNGRRKGKGKLENWREDLASGCVERAVDFPQTVDAREVAVTNDERVIDDPGYQQNPTVRAAYLEDVVQFSRVDPDHGTQCRYDMSPLSFQFVFLISSVSEPDLNVAKYISFLCLDHG